MEATYIHIGGHPYAIALLCRWCWHLRADHDRWVRFADRIPACHVMFCRCWMLYPREDERDGR